MRLRMLLKDSNGDFGRIRAAVGPRCASAMEILEDARHKLATHMPNRLMILSVHNSQIQDVENLSVEIKIGGAVYDATVNEEGERARSLAWSPDRIDVDIPRVHPGYTANVQVWYYFMGPDKRVFPDAADFEWAKTQGVVIQNMSISNGQLRRSQKLLTGLEAYHRYPVDPVKGSPSFGREISLPDVKPDQPDSTPAPAGTSLETAPTEPRLLRVQLAGNSAHTAAQTHVTRGRKLYADGDVDGAIREFRAAIGLDPKLATAHYLLGLSLHYKKDTDGEIAEYRAALRLIPTIPDAHLYLGEALERKGDLDGATGEFASAILMYTNEHDPNALKAYCDLGSAFAQQKNYPGAIAEFRTAIKIKPDNPAPHLGLGMVLEEQKQYEQAFEEYKRALALDPNSQFVRSHYEYLSGFLDKK